MDNFAAVIITEDHYNALGVIRSLGECGIEIILVLIADGKTYVDSSKFVGKTVKTARTEIDILNALRQVTEENTECKYVLFPLSDFAALILDKNYNSFGNNVYAPNMSGKMEQYQNKYFSKIKAAECGLTIARDTVLNVEEQLPEWNIYPAILKPLASVEGFKSDISILNNRHELIECVSSFKTKGYRKVLLEEYIQGRDEHMIEVMGYAANGTVKIAGIISKIREYPIKKGSTSYAEIVAEHKDINFENIKRYIKNSGFSGLFDMEFKYSDGKAYFIECNFRNGAPAYALTCKGNNIPVGWLENVLEISVERKNRVTKKNFFMVEQNDLINMLKGEVHIGNWVKDFKNSNKLFFSAKDLKPVIIYYSKLVQQIIKRFL